MIGVVVVVSWEEGLLFRGPCSRLVGGVGHLLLMVGERDVGVGVGDWGGSS